MFFPNGSASTMCIINIPISQSMIECLTKFCRGQCQKIGEMLLLDATSMLLMPNVKDITYILKFPCMYIPV